MLGRVRKTILCGHPKQGIQGEQNQSLATRVEVGFLGSLGLDNMGDIQSLKPLAQLSQLHRVTFVESTNILDGDLSPLVGLPSLELVSFQNRRHYSHRREAFRPLTP